MSTDYDEVSTDTRIAKVVSAFEDPVTLDPETTFGEALHRFRDHHIPPAGRGR